jgi:TatD DNase family protein
MNWIDTHAHLYADEFNEDRKEMIQRAFDAGVHRIFLPNIDLKSIDGMLSIVQDYPGQIFPMIGLHPCDVGADFNQTLSEMEALLEKQNPYVAIGEIGIDLYWDKTTLETQQKAFKRQIEWGLKYNKPIVIHSREATEEIIEILSLPEYKDSFGIFHCFSGNEEQAKLIIDLGFLLGIGGVLTYKNSKLREVLQTIPLDKLVLETDSPYLTPVPYRGKRNESCYIPIIGEALAMTKGIGIEEVAAATSNNALKIFGIEK